MEATNKYLIAAWVEKPEVKQIFHDWFKNGKIQGNEFFKNLNLNKEAPEVATEFEKHKAWREKTKMNATPTVLVNGYPLPDNYKIEDLRYFTEFNVDVK